MTNLLPLLLQIHLQLFFRYFDQAAIGELETSNKVFGLSISTDGEGASVRMWHRQPQPHPRGRGRGRGGQEHPQLTLDELNGFSTVGVDPNVGIFIAAVNGRDTHRGRRARTFQFSTGELYHRVGHLNNRARHTERLQTRHDDGSNAIGRKHGVIGAQNSGGGGALLVVDQVVHGETDLRWNPARWVFPAVWIPLKVRDPVPAYREPAPDDLAPISCHAGHAIGCHRAGLARCPGEGQQPGPAAFHGRLCRAPGARKHVRDRDRFARSGRLFYAESVFHP